MGRRDVIGIAIFRREDWPRLLDEADDAGELESTWEEWEINLRKAQDQMDGLGIKYREVEINLDALNGFCIKEKLPNTAETRTAFVDTRLWKGAGGEHRARQAGKDL
jgi:hypothetical protein